MSGSIVLAGGLAAIFAAITLLVASLASASAERAQVHRSLAAIQAIDTIPDSMRHDVDVPFNDRVLAPALARFAAITRKFTPAGFEDRIRRWLELAGNPVTWDVERMLAFKMVGLVSGLAGGVLLGFAFGGKVLTLIGLPAACAAAGFFVPDLLLVSKGQVRQEQIQRDLPDALDLLTISVEAGLAFDAALAQVARNTQGPLAEEFFRVLQEMQIGMSRSDAIRALGARTTVAELKGFVTAMVQADAFGVPIANVLRVQSKEQRVKRSQRAEEKAQKVPVKILFPLIFCILPSLFIVIIGPAAITIYHQFIQHGIQ